jgi:hypothetical protein
MDPVVRLLRIERLTSRQEGQHSGSMDVAPWEAVRNDSRGASALCHIGIDEGWIVWCESAATETH